MRDMNNTNVWSEPVWLGPAAGLKSNGPEAELHHCNQNENKENRHKT